MPRFDFSAINSVSALQRQFAPPKAFDPSDVLELKPEDMLPMDQQAALIRMLGWARGHDVLDRLKHRPTYIEPTDATTHALRMAGLAVKPPGKSWHMLTPPGRRRAELLMRRWAREYGLHHFKLIPSRYHVTDYCTCGWSFAHSKNQGHITSASQRERAKHLQSVSAAQAADRAAGSVALPKDRPAAQVIEVSK